MNAVHRMIQLIACLVLLASLAVTPQGAARANPGTLYVSTAGSDGGPNDCLNPASPCKTIAHAIDEAVTGDTIRVTAATYAAGTTSSGLVVSKNITLSGGWNSTFVSASGKTTLDGGNARRCMTVSAGVTATVIRFRMQNGRFLADGGGGITNPKAGVLTLKNSVVANNQASVGGGIFNYGTLTIDHSTITGNKSPNDRGGGIASEGTLTLSYSVVSSNQAHNDGGGIWAGGKLTINHSTINNNTAGDPSVSPARGGGIFTMGGTLINDTTIRANRSLGGSNGSVSAIYVDAGTVLNNTTVRGNTQHTAIYVSSGSLTLNNSTVSGNSSTAGPGGIYDVWGNVTLNNSTVTNNRSQDDTAGIRKATGYGGTVILRNSIVAGNISATVAVNQGPDCRGVMTSHGYNLIGNKLGCTFSAKPGDKVGTNASPIDPRLGSLRNNGGSTWTHALAGNSPALNAGNPAVPGSGGDACLATDQRGVDRVAEHDCDMGAFEGHFVVVLSVIRTSPNPTSASTVTYKVTFSDPVTGVDKSAPFNDFGFTLTGVTGASVSSVSGSGKIYTVTVNTGTGGGTLQLNIVDNDTIKDAAGKPLGQSGKGNGNFAGQVYTVNR